MKSKKYTVSFSPTEEQMEEIYSWTSFPPNNFSAIDQSYTKNNICIALEKDLVIGFFSYKLTPRCIEIVIAETKQEYRNTGVAKLILEKLTSYYSTKGYIAFYLYCSPEESQYAWKKLGFEYYPENSLGNRNDKINMFYIFEDCCNILGVEQKRIDTNFIEIWNKNAVKDDISPTWFAKIDLDESNNLVKPLIFFGDKDWNIKIKVGNIEKFGRYKDFFRKREVSECFFIDKLEGFQN